VPDERMLPAESIRFFQIDPIWMECLVDGAFSIGRVLSKDRDRDKMHKDKLGNISPGRASGFMIRSDLVAGWPGLQVEGYDEATETVEKMLIEDLPLSFEADLNAKKISVELENELKGSTSLSSNCTIESMQWLIKDGEPKFLLSKRENNIIDIWSAKPQTYRFSIDAGFETSLNAGSLSTDLQQVFKDQNQEVSQNSQISVVSWFITDVDQRKHYLITREEYAPDAIISSRYIVNISCLYCEWSGCQQIF
jgi:hypothetical protein